jgi:catechol 2,3-dioxygenase-like lactoylglutathione lyase family enzyme
MFSHITLGVNEIDEAVEFYDAVMATLGQKRFGRGDSWAGYGQFDGVGIGTLWILIPRDGKPATSGNGTNVALLAPDRSSVERFHATALEHGGVDEGRPSLRPENHENFYAAYVRDPAGNKLLAVCHDPIGP